jgi:CDP-glycerol glycerophosphotransferase (TagB/SpsB family)
MSLIKYKNAELYRKLKLSVIFITKPLWIIIDFIVPKEKNLFVVSSFPDYDDSARAMIDAASVLGMDVVVMLVDKDATPPLWARKKFVRHVFRYSLIGVWLYHRATYVFFTHGLFSKYQTSKRKMVVNLWHGMPIKRIGLMDGKAQSEIPNFDYTLASSVEYQSIMAASFGVGKDRVLIGDHPRLDILRRATSQPMPKMGGANFSCVWLPTYRHSVLGDCRTDGAAHGDVFNDQLLLMRLDKFFMQHSVVCFAKPHPMAVVDHESFSIFSNIKLIDEISMARDCFSIYEILGKSDFLITDISSVYVDYLAVSRPIVVFCPDLQDYEKNRGFSATISDLIHHRICASADELVDELTIALDDVSRSKSRGTEHNLAASAAESLILKVVGIQNDRITS